MDIRIKQPAALLEKGNRNENEDFVYPLANQVNPEERLFIVCDGESEEGSGKEVARLAALSFARYFAETPPPTQIDPDYLNQGLRLAEGEIRDFKLGIPERENAATALGLIYIGIERITLAWVGNIRLYHYSRQKKELTAYGSGGKMDIGELVSGAGSPKSMQIATLEASSLAPGDFLAMCTDGVEEAVDRTMLKTLFEAVRDQEPDFLIEEIQNLSLGYATDNSACYLIQIESLDGQKQDEAIQGVAASHAASGNHAPSQDQKALRYAIPSAILLLLVVVGWWYFAGRNRFPEYQKYIEKGDLMMSKMNFSNAVVMYDSAFLIAESEDERYFARTQKEKAAARLVVAPGEEPLDQLTRNADEYLSEAEGFFDAGNFSKAAANYRRAERLLLADESDLTDFPYPDMADAFLKTGDILYTEDQRNCPGAKRHYETAMRIIDNEELKKLKEARQRSVARIQACDEQSPTLASNRGQSPEQAPATDAVQGQKDRSMAAAGQETAPAKSPGSKAEKKQATRSLDTKQEAVAQRQQDLSAGKRYFVKARESQSDFDYKRCAAHLLNSSSELDGKGAYMLSFIYHNGLGLPKDEANALKYAQRSALDEWPPGHYLYAHLLLQRKNSRDSITAIESLRKAADLNFLDAHIRLEELGAN